ncbi:lamin tail domain-containing protein [Pseudochryseolinea flava]|uniref:LTD domain-containing protein n=1 Tax=Pseudochryseolinea flava TaxID=2059302 RepID=A0A364Y2L4_9BACT|nr:lamin tail domain-containing protein [Pseudochryseolinea flava]RAW00552.1 hypothetical protein DQQ10_13210 [Pseudochryseolinea flava]
MPQTAPFSELKKHIVNGSAWLVLALATAFLASCGPGDDEDPEPTPEEVAINEVYSAGDDWIELYNSSDSPMNIGGYKIFDDETDKYTLPAGTTVPANGFLVLLADGTATGIHTNFKITSDGETIYLENASGTLIDKAEVPALSNGQSFGRFPDGTGGFQISGNSSKAESNNDANAPAISDVTRIPLVPGLNQDVNVTAKVISATIIGSVKLVYRFDGGSFKELNMVAAGSIYSATIPAQNAEGEIEYYILAKSSAGVQSRHPANTENYHDYLLNDDELPVLKINEFMALNVSCCPDDDSGAEEFDDWIEIYNPNDFAVPIAGMYLSDNKDNPFGSKIPSDVPPIPAGGFVVFWADEMRDQGSYHLNFKLSGTGEDIGLFYIDGRLIDSYTYGAQADDVSYGRTSDGGDTWGSLTPSQGSSNNK